MRRPGRKLALDGSVPGVEYARHRSGYSHTPLDGHLQPDLPHPQQPYDPSPGAPDFRQPEYEPYHPHLQIHSTPALRLDPLGRPPEPAEHIPTYEEGVHLQEIMSEHLAQLYSSGQAASEADAAASCADLGQIVDEAFGPDPIAEMTSELEQLTAQTQEQPAPQEPQPTPEQDLAQEIFDEQMLWFNQFGMTGPMGPMM